MSISCQTTMYKGVLLRTYVFTPHLAPTLSGVASPLEVIPSNIIETVKAKVQQKTGLSPKQPLPGGNVWTDIHCRIIVLFQAFTPWLTSLYYHTLQLILAATQVTASSSPAHTGTSVCYGSNLQHCSQVAPALMCASVILTRH